MLPFKRIQWTVCTVGIALTITACGASPSGGSSPMPSEPQASVPAAKESVIKVYYGDKEGTNLLERNATVRYTSDQEKYAAALNELKKAPDGDVEALFGQTDFRSIMLKDGTLTVDLVLSPGNRLGSGGEALYLQALKNTLFQFAEVQALDLLVDGKKPDSIMGHVELPALIRR